MTQLHYPNVCHYPYHQNETRQQLELLRDIPPTKVYQHLIMTDISWDLPTK